MKDKIIMLIIGILIGAIIASGCFLLFGKANQSIDDSTRGTRPDMGNFTPGDMPEGMQGGTMRDNSQQSPTTDSNSI